MKLPPGDHTGSDVTTSLPSTRRSGAPPSAGTLYRGFAFPSLIATAIHFPSGDQDGAVRTSSASASGCASVPSEAMTWRRPAPCAVRTTKAIRVPSEVTAGAAITGPSLPLQSSVSEPSLYFHSPSGPPFDERYAR